MMKAWCKVSKWF